jgi:Spy/CpxP family protein refolding chaperone
MKPITAIMISMLAGVATFAFEGPGRQAHAAAFQVPTGPNWRQDMLAHDPGETGIDHRVLMITSHLDLTSAQATKVRAILDREHDRIEAALLTAPPSLSRDQFVAERNEVRLATRKEIDALLTPEQHELAEEFRPASQPTPN